MSEPSLVRIWHNLSNEERYTIAGDYVLFIKQANGKWLFHAKRYIYHQGNIIDIKPAGASLRDTETEARQVMDAFLKERDL